jgi:type IV secretory pathway VirD2 relaxase
MLWGNKKVKSKGLTTERRREIADNVIARLEQSKELKVVADNMAGIIADLLHGIKNDTELRYAIGVGTSQLRRYVANQVYQRLRGEKE